MHKDTAGNETTLTIDGQICTVPPGTTVLKAAATLGIEIPTLCYLKDLTPDGSCRMCVVEVEGGRKGGLVTACTELCEEGMVIRSKSPRVVESRRFVLDLLLSNHNQDCFSCGRNGSCKLQDYSLEYGLEKTTFAPGRHIPPGGMDDSNPFFSFQPEKCIMCRKCARVCESLQGRDVLSITGRGFDTHISTCYDTARTDPDCESCGNCVSACPTGALTSRDQRYGYRAYEVTATRTTCPHCAVGCQFDLLTKNGRLVGVNPADGPSNNGMLCVKGKFGSYKFVNAPDRLKTPLIKRSGIFEEATWDEALDLIADKFTAIKNQHGPSSLAGFSCSRAPNEDNYMFQKMMRAAVGTNNVDNCARVCHSATVAGLAMTLGSGAMTNPFNDITRDVEVILLVGSNPEEAHPVMGTKLRRAVREGAKLIVVDPRKIGLTRNAEMHLQLKPGTNVAFANGMIHIILRDGLADLDFIQSRTEGFDELAQIVSEYTPQRVAEICGIDADDLCRAAHLYAKAKKAPIIYCLGVTEHSTGTEGVMSLSNLAMVVGKIGRSGCGINPIRGQNNVQGACDMGCLPGDFPGYQKVNSPDARKKFSDYWGVELSAEPGLMATQIPHAVEEGKIRGLFIFGEDPMRTDPDITHIQRMLESLDFLVVQELFLTKTAQYADVVLPGMSYAEKEGTFSNSERRVQRVRTAVTLEGNMRLDTDIFTDLMVRMGYPQPRLTAAEIMQEISTLTPIFRGISHARLDRGEALTWPCISETDPGTSILHQGKFTRGLGYLYPARYIPSKELPDETYPLILITGRMLYQYNAGAMTQRTEGLNQLAPASYMEMHRQDAAALGIHHGDRIRVNSRRGEITTVARIGEKTNVGQVFMPFHFEDGNANYLTNPAVDQFARIPEYKVCAVRVQRG